jgi:O-methyltransferase
LEKDDHPVWQNGALTTVIEKFHRICKSNGVPREAYTTVEGFYNDSLDSASADAAPTKIRLDYIGCDMNSITQNVLNFLRARLKHGVILAFDDYCCWSDTQVLGERLAMLEAFEGDDQWNLLPYVQYTRAGTFFVLESKVLLKTGK